MPGVIGVGCTRRRKATIPSETNCASRAPEAVRCTRSSRCELASRRRRCSRCAYRVLHPGRGSRRPSPAGYCTRFRKSCHVSGLGKKPPPGQGVPHLSVMTFTWSPGAPCPEPGEWFGMTFTWGARHHLFRNSGRPVNSWPPHHLPGHPQNRRDLAPRSHVVGSRADGGEPQRHDRVGVTGRLRSLALSLHVESQFDT
jgi:hypothetical protein